MWRPWKKKTKRAADPKISFPQEKEIRLMRGTFRDWSADSGKERYYGLCTYSTDSICPPGEIPCQMEFFRLVCKIIKEFLHGTPSAILMDDLSHLDAWEKQKVVLEQLTRSHSGAFFEEHGKVKSSYAFVFSEMPDSFLEEVYWWMAKHTCREDIYVQYSILGNGPSACSSISEVNAQTILNILMDEVHPVLILQLAPSYPIAHVTEVLLAVCNREGWTLSLP